MDGQVIPSTTCLRAASQLRSGQWHHTGLQSALPTSAAGLVQDPGHAAVLAAFRPVWWGAASFIMIELIDQTSIC